MKKSWLPFFSSSTETELSTEPEQFLIKKSDY